MKAILTLLAVLAVSLAGCADGDQDREQAHDHDDHAHMEDTDMGEGDMKSQHEAIVAAAATYPIDFQKAVSMMGHAHATTEILAGQVVPTLDAEVIPDPMKAGQYNLHLEVTGFSFAPQNVSTAAQYGEGHTHVYLDDVLVARAYGAYFHLAFVEPGDHTVKVTLNHNDHSEYSLNGESIVATVDFSVPEPTGTMMHGH